MKTPTKTRTIDRSKRVAPGGEIDTKNIMKTKLRTGTKNKENQPSNKRKSLEKKPVEKKPVEKKPVEKKPVEKAEKVEQEKTPLESVTQSVENMKVSEPKKETPTKTRKSNSKDTKDTKDKSIKGLSPKVITQIERLGGKMIAMGERRYYREAAEPMPVAIQMFCDAFIGQEENKFCSVKHKLEEVNFGQEFTLEEFEDFKYLKKDDILIGDGESLIVVNGKDTREDFEVSLVEDEESKPLGPFKISEFLKSLEPTQITEEE